jgi:hypothetical protein
LFGLETPDPVQLSPGEVVVAIDGTGRVACTLITDVGKFEMILEPAGAYNLGFQLIDKALRACRGSWDAALRQTFE